MSVALSIYHRLPPGSRSVVASLRGLYLNWWRFDKNTERLVSEALERDFWTPEQWRVYREERLAYLLERAARDVPFYREIWAERRRRGDQSSVSYLENWPILEKSSLRARSCDFVADDCVPARMFHDHTSGTTATSLDIWLSRSSVKQWYALFEARSRRWYGLTRHDRWAIFGGQLVVPVERRGPPFWVWNAAMKQLYLSSYHLSPEMLRHYLKALATYRIRYIVGYPSAIYALALEALKSPSQAAALDIVVTNAEPLYEHQRAAIAEAFSCAVRETYGMAEIAAAASECENGRLHEWPDAGIIEESIDDESDGDSHDLICTGLINADMPLIRYRVGDRGRLSKDACNCGRTLPLIDRIDGRCDDVLFTADGRSVGRLDPIFKSGLPIREAQIIQKALDLVLVRYVPDAGFERRSLTTLATLIRQRMGEIAIEFEELAQIPRTSRGKFRAVVCEIQPHERPTGARNAMANV